jgi:hypothetical protein
MYILDFFAIDCTYNSISLSYRHCLVSSSAHFMCQAVDSFKNFIFYKFYEYKIMYFIIVCFMWMQTSKESQCVINKKILN